MAKQFFVYILASGLQGTLYVGMTSALLQRVAQHKQKLLPGFTNKYEINRLVYFEVHEEPGSAICREKQIKEWQRDWKIALIEEANPRWLDLSLQIAA